MGEANETELRIIGWLESERERGSKVWSSLREIAEDRDHKVGGNDWELANRLDDLLDGSAMADIQLNQLGADLARARSLSGELAGPDGADWLTDVEPRVIRVFLLRDAGTNGEQGGAEK